MKPFFVWLRALFVKKSPFVKKTTWTAIFRAAASFARYLDQYQSFFTGKATNRAFKVVNGILNFQIFLTLTLTQNLTLYTKNTVAW